MISPALLNSYRYWRQQAPTRTAEMALFNARKDAANGKTRYPASGGMGAAFKVGADMCRWVESPKEYGLRFVGPADEVASQSIQHTGWFLDDDHQDETARGAVFQLPARNGKPQFVAAVLDPCNNGPAIVAFDDITDEATTAASWADQLAECYAEEERDYRRGSNARFVFDELGCDVVSNRREALTLIREAKALRDAFGPKVCATVRAAIESLIRDIRKARARRARLESEFASHPSWQDA